MALTFSIITPCRNAAATIAATLDSVTAQGLTGGLEHIVIDGASDDGTLDVLRSRTGLRVTSEPDTGLANAMNKGLRQARNDIIGWLNADDVYLPDALSEVAEAFEAHPEALWVTGRCPIVDASGREIRKAVTRYKNALLEHYTFGLHLTQNFVSCPSTFVRRAALDRVGYLDERFRYSMDYDWFLRLGRISPPVVLDRPLATFTMAPGSLSMEGFERQFQEHAQNAREHGQGHPFAVGANAAMSASIVASYRLLRAKRRLTERVRGPG